MSRIQEGKQELVPEWDQVRHPSNLSVVRIEPSKIRLIAHRMVPIDVPIKVQTSGKLPPGLTLRQIVVSPKSIQSMALPKGKKGVQILTEPINLQDIKTTSTLTPRLVLPSDVRLVSDKPPNVRVTIEIEQQKL